MFIINIRVPFLIIPKKFYKYKRKRKIQCELIYFLFYVLLRDKKKLEPIQVVLDKRYECKMHFLQDKPNKIIKIFSNKLLFKQSTSLNSI